MSTKPSEEPAHKAGTPFCVKSQDVSGADVLTIFVTGNELGELRPCGCSGGQLGGFDRRWAVLNSAGASKRMIVDAGSFVKSDSEQDQIKFDIIIEAFSRLDYDLVNLTEKDIEIARNRGLLDSISAAFNIISSQGPPDVNVPAKFTKRFSLNNSVVAVNIASVDLANGYIKRLGGLLTRPTCTEIVATNLNMLILNERDAAAIDTISKMGIVDCLVVPSESDEPEVISEPNKSPLVISVGRYGRYVCRLQIKATEAKDRLKLGFRAIPVTEDLDRKSSLVQLYKAYQQFVKEAELLERQPCFPLPNGLEYVGSESCGLCHEHEYEYKKWSTGPHAHAYARLEKVGSQYDPECVVCHVVGMGYESGFVSEEKTGHLKNVGCENCHGPGSKHIKEPLKEKTSMPMSDCTDCHTPETSGEYMDKEQLYFEKIIHWREPNAAGNVK